MSKKIYTNYEHTCEELVDTLIDMLFENREHDFEFWKEILCRRLLKWGYLKKEDGYYKTTGKGTENTLHLELIKKDKEIERLNNIIDKFEKYLINEIKRLESVEQTPAIVLITGKIHDIYDELQELKEGEK